MKRTDAISRVVEKRCAVAERQLCIALKCLRQIARCRALDKPGSRISSKQFATLQTLIENAKDELDSIKAAS